jgi:hypothetical protein
MTARAATLPAADLADLFPGPVIVTEIREPVAPPNGALVLWDEQANEGVIIQPLYTEKDRDRLRRQMQRIADEKIQKG